MSIKYKKQDSSDSRWQKGWFPKALIDQQMHWQKLIKVINFFSALTTCLLLQEHLLLPVHGERVGATPGCCSESLPKWTSSESVFHILLSTAAAAVAEKYLSVLQCIHPWLKHCVIVLGGPRLSSLHVWNVSRVSEWSAAARIMDAQCPGDGAALHHSKHPPCTL